MGIFFYPRVSPLQGHNESLGSDLLQHPLLGVEQSSLPVLSSSVQVVRFGIADGINAGLLAGRLVVSDLLSLDRFDDISQVAHGGGLPSSSGCNQEPIQIGLGLPSIAQLQLKLNAFNTNIILLLMFLPWSPS